jgi:hypothetical protein
MEHAVTRSTRHAAWHANAPFAGGEHSVRMRARPPTFRRLPERVLPFLIVAGSVPDRIGRYEVLGELATGGMAQILLARLRGPAGFERAVVLKRILPHLARSESFTAMFLDEARTVARIRHPNVVQVQELGREGSELVLAMEYVEGESIAGIMKRALSTQRKVSPALAAYIVAEACSGLHAAHVATDLDGKPLEVVHRDVSPQNVMVTYDGQVKVLDFGVARAADRTTLTEAGQVKGKFEYMAPEQCHGKRVDRRTDVFALGIVLYELVAQRRLFKRATPLETMRAICEQSVVPPCRVDATFPPRLEAIVLRALGRRPEDRYPSAVEMRRELLAAVAELGPPDEGGNEALARWMASTFADRIAEKKELLRRARAGDDLTHVPAGEADEAVEVPSVVADEGTSAGSYLEAAQATASRRRARSWVIGGAVIALAAGGSFAGVRWMAGRAALGARAATSPAAPAVPPAIASEPRVSSQPLAPPPTGTPQVTLHVESKPAGAHVLFDGVDRGLTPNDLTVPRSSAPHAIRLQRTGFAAYDENVTPDMDQRLVVALTLAGHAGVPRTAAAAPAPATSAHPPAAAPSATAEFPRFQ